MTTPLNSAEVRQAPTAVQDTLLLVGALEIATPEERPAVEAKLFAAFHRIGNS